jgi:hypothetical protein
LYLILFLNNVANAQLLLFPKIHVSEPSTSSSILQSYHPNQTPQQSLQPIKQNQPNLHLVKITLPAKGQQVPVGKNLIIFGTSTDNATSNCKVSIKANGVGPYRDASPTSNSSGRGGNYSNWNFTITPAYTTIKEGQNKITAKFACSSDPTLVSHYSVNVTGIREVANNTSGQQTTSYLSSSSKPVANYANGDVNTTRNVPISSQSLSKSPAVINTNSKKPLFLTLSLGKSSAHLGDVETLTVGVTDSNSSKAISGATVLGNISSSSAVYKRLKGSTDSKGQATYSWMVGSSDSTGKYKVALLGYAPGYESGSTSKTFRVTPIPAAVANPSSSTNSLTPPIYGAGNIGSNVSLPPPAAAPSTTHTKTKTHHHLPSTTNPNPGTSNNINNNNVITPPALTTPPAAAPSTTHTKTKTHHQSTVNPSQSFGIPITRVPFTIP